MVLVEQETEGYKCVHTVYPNKQTKRRKDHGDKLVLMDNARSGWDYSNNATKWGFKINTFKVTQYTISGHFATSMFAMTSGTKPNITPLKSTAKLISSTPREEVGVHIMIDFHSIPHTVEQLNEHRDLQWVLLTRCIYTVLFFVLKFTLQIQILKMLPT